MYYQFFSKSISILLGQIMYMDLKWMGGPLDILHEMVGKRHFVDHDEVCCKVFKFHLPFLECCFHTERVPDERKRLGSQIQVPFKCTPFSIKQIGKQWEKSAWKPPIKPQIKKLPWIQEKMKTVITMKDTHLIYTGCFTTSGRNCRR
jgi:hypothetical protein